MKAHWNIGIIGSGFGRTVQDPAIQSIENVSTKIVSSRHEQEWMSLILNPSIDAISVAAPPNSHLTIVEAALNHGKNVLCEKPFGRNLEEAQKMVEFARSSHLYAAIDFEYRYEPMIREMQTLIQSGRLGSLQRVEVKWLTSGRNRKDLPWSWQYDRSMGGGAIAAFVSHVFDYIYFLFRKEIRISTCETKILIPERAGRTVTAEDYCKILGTVGDSATLSIEASNCMASTFGHRIEVIGQNGSLLFFAKPPFGPDSTEVHWTGIDGSLEIFRSPLTVNDPKLPSLAIPFRNLFIDFLELLKNQIQNPNLPTFEDGARVRKLIDHCQAISKNH